ncbi:MAG TPA: DUF362 domain-containing protein [Bryobacteraceae bacterium]
MAELLRRSLFQLAGAAALLRGRLAGAQAAAPAPQQAPRKNFPPITGLTEGFPENPRATVSVTHGEDRRKNAYNALLAIDKELQPKLKLKKYVVIKPNNVNTVNQLAATHVDALRGILDYLALRFKGPVVIAESSAGETHTGFENFKYTLLPAEYKRQKVSLIDLNEEAKFERLALLDPDLHLVPVRLAARLLDPEAFVISSCMLKTHNTVIASLNVKNMVLGAPLHQAPKETPRWNEKRKYHVGLRQTHYNMMLTAQKLHPHWGLALIDGFEGMEGNGPNSGTPVPSRIAIASTDYIAADRVGAEAMGIDPEWLGYLIYCGHIGLGQYDLSKIDVIGAALKDVRKSYRMHPDIDRELQWRGPMKELPFNLGWTHPITHTHQG